MQTQVKALQADLDQASETKAKAETNLAEVSAALAKAERTIVELNVVVENLRSAPAASAGDDKLQVQLEQMKTTAATWENAAKEAKRKEDVAAASAKKAA